MRTRAAPLMCRDRTHVITTVEHRSASTAESVHELAETCTEALHPVRQRDMTRTFDQEMHVIALNRIVDDAKAIACTRLRQQHPTMPHETRPSE